MADYGRVIAVNTFTVGDEVVGRHNAGVSSLQLDDASEFPEEGGTISLPSGTLLVYDAADHDNDTLDLHGSLPTALADEARILLWDEDRGAAATETIAYTMLEGSEDDGDPFEAVVPQSLRSFLPDGVRAGKGEVVEIDVAGEAVADVPGRTPQLDGQAVWNPHSYRTFNGQDISTNTWEQLIGWADVETDSVTFDTGQWKIVYPAWYSITASITWTSNATGRRRIRLVINGAVVEVGVAGADPDIETYGTVTSEKRLAEGDVIQVFAYQTSGGILRVTDGAFSIHRLSI